MNSLTATLYVHAKLVCCALRHDKCIALEATKMCRHAT